MPGWGGHECTGAGAQWVQLAAVLITSALGTLGSQLTLEARLGSASRRSAGASRRDSEGAGRMPGGFSYRSFQLHRVSLSDSRTQLALRETTQYCALGTRRRETGAKEAKHRQFRSRERATTWQHDAPRTPWVAAAPGLGQHRRHALAAPTCYRRSRANVTAKCGTLDSIAAIPTPTMPELLSGHLDRLPSPRDRKAAS